MAVTSPSYSQTSTRLEDIFGQGLSWTPLAGSSATAWETSAFHMQWTGNGESEVELRRLWEARKGHLGRLEQGNSINRRGLRPGHRVRPAGSTAGSLLKPSIFVVTSVVNSLNIVVI